MGLIRIIKKYKELGHKEFMKRLKEGAEKITPLQQTKATLQGSWIITIGIVFGIVANAIIRIKGFWYWVEIILVGSLFVQGVSLLGTYQKYWVLKTQEEIMKQLGIIQQENPILPTENDFKEKILC